MSVINPAVLVKAETEFHAQPSRALALTTSSRHKKTTHALHRRFAVISDVSTADVTRLPNWGEFCIRGEFEHTQQII
jgi:hypothetical protein